MTQVVTTEIRKEIIEAMAETIKVINYEKQFSKHLQNVKKINTYESHLKNLHKYLQTGNISL